MKKREIYRTGRKGGTACQLRLGKGDWTAEKLVSSQLLSEAQIEKKRGALHRVGGQKVYDTEK